MPQLVSDILFELESLFDKLEQNKAMKNEKKFIEMKRKKCLELNNETLNAQWIFHCEHCENYKISQNDLISVIVNFASCTLTFFY